MGTETAPGRSTRVWLTVLRAAALFGAAALLLVGLISPELAVDQVTLSTIAFTLLVVGIATFIDFDVKLYRPPNLGIIVAVGLAVAAALVHYSWREGQVVAIATFNPGIAPFRLTVREVPVPVTHSNHFIVTLKRGQYPVTSFRYFWIAYTPKKVRIEWPRLESFKVIFDERYIAICNWRWGQDATWTMQMPPNAEEPGDRP